MNTVNELKHKDDIVIGFVKRAVNGVGGWTYELNKIDGYLKLTLLNGDDTIGISHNGYGIVIAKGVGSLVYLNDTETKDELVKILEKCEVEDYIRTRDYIIFGE